MRTARQLSQLALADRLGVGFALIQQLESGRRRFVRAYEVDSLVRTLDVPADDLWSCLPVGARFMKWIPLGSAMAQSPRDQ